MRARILTYNIHKAIGGVDRRYRPERICEVLTHHAPDIVMLQEVDDGVRRSKNHRQVDILGDALGYPHRIWFPNVRIRSGGHYGNAILSRFPITHAENIDLTIGWRKRRSVLHARLRARFDGRSRTIHAFNLHLGLSEGERRKQLERFLACDPFAHLHDRTPLVVAGDFNDVFGTLGERCLKPAGFRGHSERLATFPAFAPVRALDSIYVRGDVKLMRVERPRTTVSRQASDHLPLIADVELGR